MPMRPRRTPTVVRHTRQHTSRAERTANIHVASRADVQLSKSPDLYSRVSDG